MQKELATYKLDTNRDFSIDLMKGIAIFLVVLGHLPISLNIIQWIYSFHMPFFMFLSGLLATKPLQTQSNIWNKSFIINLIKKKIYSLLIPFTTWPLIISLVHLNKPNFNLWFLSCLFCIFLIYYTILYVSKKYNNFFIGMIAFIVSICLVYIIYILFRLKLAINTCVFFLPFSIGIIYQVFSIREKLAKRKWFYVLLIIIFILTSSSFKFENHSLTYTAIKLISGISFSIIIHPISIYINKNKIKFQKLFIPLGKQTLEIYCIHGIFITYYHTYIYNNDYYLNSVLAPISAYLICIICICISDILKKNKTIAFLLYGKTTA